ncbi:LacI family transcriptional regulator [Collibacillus ludicampi]|uniref:LacI family transcriptional regulator n=1 Tax=Collibacillus ludicampi TaxID=2771369 RepID=A0AAV4LBH4_9BACL|nr:substrate-binding domain-containing protein [Collibacillus ludicampi]GIM44832.1 LacI family transcriptional regulator [Collibacillus ludicampi]
MARVKMEDVAKLAGVSKSTVSQYLNKRYEYMSIETRQRIEQAIKETGYQRNVVARSLKVKKTHTIGVIVANILHYFSTAISRGIEDYCNKHGFNVIVCNADDNPVKEREYIEMLLAKQVDGLILASTNENNDLLKKLVEGGFPLVLVDRKLDGIEADGVFSNNVKASVDAISHFIKLGHRSIALFSPAIKKLSQRKERYEGYLRALSQHHIEIQEQYIKFVDKISDTRKIILELLHLPVPPTALFCTNDLTTIETLKVLKEEKVNIPSDIAVIGFDDSPWLQLLEPPLTTVVQQTYDMGVKSAELLLNKIENPHSKHCTVHIMDCQLIVRESCGFLRAGVD